MWHICVFARGSFLVRFAQCRLWLSCGGFHERTLEGHDGSEAAAEAAPPGALPKVFNSHLLIAPNGELAAVYRKVRVWAHGRKTEVSAGLYIHCRLLLTRLSNVQLLRTLYHSLTHTPATQYCNRFNLFRL
jgi:hypothetical protein